MMMNASLGDLSQSFALRNRNAVLKADMLKLGQELASGRVADPRSVLNGNLSYLSEIERSLVTMDGYNVATTEAGHFAGGVNAALTRIQEQAQTLSADLVLAGNSTAGLNSAELAGAARSTLGSVVSSLNQSVAGRTLFSGTASDRMPLDGMDPLLDALRPVLAAQTTPADMMAAAKAWFDDPAGYAGTVYQGSAQGISPMVLSETDTVALDVKATDPALREMLLGSAVASLADDPALTLSNGDQLSLLATAGFTMMSANSSIISLQSRVGYAEAAIDRVTSRNAAERSSLEFAKSDLLGVDPFEAATKLENVQFQLQSLYTVTSRMSQLSLVNFL